MRGFTRFIEKDCCTNLLQNLFVGQAVARPNGAGSRPARSKIFGSPAHPGRASSCQCHGMSLPVIDYHSLGGHAFGVRVCGMAARASFGRGRHAFFTPLRCAKKAPGCPLRPASLAPDRAIPGAPVTNLAAPPSDNAPLSDAALAAPDLGLLRDRRAVPPGHRREHSVGFT